MKQYLHRRIATSRLVFAQAQPEHVVFAAPKRVQADICQHFRRTVSAHRFMDGDNQIMIGTEAARLSQVRTGDKIIVLASDMYGDM